MYDKEKNKVNDRLYYYYSNGDLIVSGGMANIIGEGVTRMIKSEGTVLMNNDIVLYNSDYEYTSISQIPKVIVYAKNIKIDFYMD